MFVFIVILSNTKLPTCLLFYTSEFIISVSFIYSLSLSSDFFYLIFLRIFFFTPNPRRSADSSAGVEHRICDRKVAVRSPTGTAGDFPSSQSAFYADSCFGIPCSAPVLPEHGQC